MRFRKLTIPSGRREDSSRSSLTVTIRFYEELNYFLPELKRKQPFEAPLYPGQSVKDLIESLNVPHVEVDLILINGVSVDFSFQPAPGDYISVYPVFESLNIENVTRLRPLPLRVPAFALDVHLGKLARYLRLLGFRAAYRKNWDDAELVAYGVANSLIVLTRDRGLLKRKLLKRGMFVFSTDPEEQLREICRRLDLYSMVNPYTRCLSCGGKLRDLVYGSGEFLSVQERIPPGVLSWCREYSLCTVCGKLFWKGSHIKHLDRIIRTIQDESLL